MNDNLKELVKEASKHFRKFKLDDECNKVLNTSQFTSAFSKKEDKAVRFVIISDTHGLTKDLNQVIPDGDILIHCGDFTAYGKEKEVIKFNDFLCLVKEKFKHIVVISGNHELTFDPSIGSSSKHPDELKELLTNCIYLQDEGIDLMGIKIYGSPWHPDYRGTDAFSVTCGEECMSKWNLIPEDVDVLMTHTPPYGFCDLSSTNKHNGCIELLSVVQQNIKPKLHAFGHIHEAYGVATDGTTTYVNASVCTRHYQPDNLPIVFDVIKP